MFVLNGVLPVSVKDGNHVTPAGPFQALFTANERETAIAIVKAWYAKGWKPVLTHKETDANGYYSFTVVYNYRHYDRAAKAKAKAKATKAARKAA